jgi:arginine decarboxylase
MQLRQRIRESATLRPYFEVLDDDALIPACYREPPAPDAGESLSTLAALRTGWGNSDFVVDPTRVTLDISKTGFDGSRFRQLLMTRYDIQINKTSRNTVLFLINIGASQATIDYLMQVLQEMAARFQHERPHQIAPENMEASVPLPEKRLFHRAFMPFENGDYYASDMRAAYFQGGDETNVHYVPLSAESLQQIQTGKIWVSASFVTPYPPGFPVIVPGQILTAEILNFFQHIKVKEIHGFSSARGFKVFRDSHLARLTTRSPRKVEKQINNKLNQELK